MQNNWIEVGKVKEAHGLRGDIYVLVYSGDVSWLSQLEAIKLTSEEDDVDLVPELEIEKIKAHKDGFVVKLKSFLNRNMAEERKGHRVFISSELLVSEDGEEIFLNEILGFSVSVQYESSQQSLGKVVGFYNRPAYDSLQIELHQDYLNLLGRSDLVESSKSVVIEVPLVEEFVTEIDHENSLINLELPEGLVDVQLPGKVASKK